MKPDFYHIEIFEKLMELEESRGKLKDFCYSLRYLRKFFYEYNRLIGKQEFVGVPRGPSFSSVLAEIYLQEFDRKIRNINEILVYCDN